MGGVSVSECGSLGIVRKLTVASGDGHNAEAVVGDCWIRPGR